MVGLFEDFDPIEAIAKNRQGLSVKKITRGTLLSFHYPHSLANPPNRIHDSYPMIIVTDIWPKYIRGVNLHYLNFHYVKLLLNVLGEKPSATYSSQYIKGDINVRGGKDSAGAFRTYFRSGIQMPKKLDVEFLKMILTQVRSFAPNEVERIRNEIEAQIQQRLQARADELSSFEAAKKEAIKRSQNFNELRAALSQSQRRATDRRVSQIEQPMTHGPREGLINMGPDVAPPTAEGLSPESI
jgi:hypothetical protein